MIYKSVAALSRSLVSRSGFVRNMSESGRFNVYITRSDMPDVGVDQLRKE